MHIGVRSDWVKKLLGGIDGRVRDVLLAEYGFPCHITRNRINFLRGFKAGYFGDHKLLEELIEALGVCEEIEVIFE